jgi:2-polyprenyl-6-methoxyphenol hydroxylase-like FAD-dependent oxidoreductase
MNSLDLPHLLTFVVLDAANAEEPETWSFQIHHAWWGAPYAADLKDPKARLQFFKDRSSKICEPFSTIAAALPDDTILPADPGQQWSPIQWDNHNGSITIAGDAAHSMLPSE